MEPEVEFTGEYASEIDRKLLGPVLTTILRRICSVQELLIEDESLKWQTEKIYKDFIDLNRFSKYFNRFQ